MAEIGGEISIKRPDVIPAVEPVASVSPADNRNPKDNRNEFRKRPQLDSNLGTKIDKTA